MPSPPTIHYLRVFADGPNGGNPLPLVLDATGMTDASMQAVASSRGHEASFVFPAPPDSDCDLALRFWVPQHEMAMCGHATVGTVWLLAQLGRLPSSQVRVWTKSGVVECRVTERGGGIWVEISQGRGVLVPVWDGAEGDGGADGDQGVVEELVKALGIGMTDLATGYPVQNACTSRVKTIIPLKSVAVLDSLQPDSVAVKGVCARLGSGDGSTGLYPYALVAGEGKHVFSARQFPRNSGYVEDAATGIAASALAFALLENGLVDEESEITVKQGRTMGAPSSIAVRFRKGDDGEVVGCWIGGTAVLSLG